MNDTAEQDASPTTYPSSPISLDEGLVIARHFEAIAAPAGYHVALGGSVMYAGKSKKDLDLIVYPHDLRGAHNKDTFLKLVKKAGAVNIFQTDREYVNKDVVLCTFLGERVDLFFL
jgi:hypothetical protein